MKRSIILAMAIVASLPLVASAHKAWLLPSQTVIAGETPWITVDAAVSNDLFYFNHVPLQIDTLAIIAPDGSRMAAQNGSTGKYRNVFDVELTQQGTYRIGTFNNSVTATWEVNGERKRWRGDASKLASALPTGAQKLEVGQNISRVETFVTNGTPNETALKPSGLGLEMIPVTHPNDLFAGEESTMRFQIDGKPAAGLKVEIVSGGTRYRNAQDEIAVTTDANGEIKVTWPNAGMYWLDATTEDSQVSIPQASKRRLGYVATLEVLPQ